MDAKEFELTLNDLETRVDRLRALYENWFRGYEKIEPQVARKDVERRVYALRKELPRNTALRFRYHQLYQRYCTLANYWQRTARQIEEGTYRLQLQRMRRSRPSGHPPARPSQPPEELETDRPPPRTYELNPNESLSVGDLLNELEMDAVARAVDPLEKPAAPKPVTPARAKAPGSPALAPPSDDAQSGAAAAGPARQGTQAREPTKLVPPPPTSAVRPAPAAPGAPLSTPLRPSHVRSTPPEGSPTKQVPAVPRPAPSAPLPSAAARLGGPGAAGPATGVRPAPPPVQSGGTIVGRPPPPPDPRGAPTGAAPSEQRLRNLYNEYTAARRRNNEGEVRFDHLVSSIQKMLPELQRKHQGKQIDFEVVVKDGRVGLKPRAV